METGNVEFICVAAAHPPRQAPNGTGLTVHEGTWAYCASGASEGHEWKAVEHASLDVLTRAAATAARVSAKA